MVEGKQNEIMLTYNLHYMDMYVKYKMPSRGNYNFWVFHNEKQLFL